MYQFAAAIEGNCWKSIKGSFRPIADIRACCQRMAMKALRVSITFALLAWPACLLGADAGPLAKLGRIQVREFDSRTGDWHPVKQHNPDFFYGWNWRGAQSADAAGSNDDLEILVPLIGKPSSDVGRPLIVTVTSRRSAKVIESRRFAGLRLPESGTAYQVVLLKDAACFGALDGGKAWHRREEADPRPRLRRVTVSSVRFPPIPSASAFDPLRTLPRFTQSRSRNFGRIAWPLRKNDVGWKTDSTLCRS